MNIPLFKKLHAEGLIADDSLRRAEEQEARSLFSLYWELRLLLYLGVLLFTGGMGILVYKHIDTIGHQVVLAFIALVTVGCFYYCQRAKLPFNRGKVDAPNAAFDYILLLGCLCLLIFVGYWQYEYNVFGNRYGLVTFIPMVILLISAYYFDHLGILSLAITNLAAWAGIAITPLSLLNENNFDNQKLIYTGLLLGAILLLAGMVSVKQGFKAHFEATYTNFGLHLFFIAALAGLFLREEIFQVLLWFLGMAAIAVFLYRLAMARRSFYFVLMIILYSYIAVSTVVMRLLVAGEGNNLDPIIPGLFYFIFSGVGLAVLLVRINRQIKSNDRL